MIHQMLTFQHRSINQAISKKRWLLVVWLAFLWPLKAWSVHHSPPQSHALRAISLKMDVIQNNLDQLRRTIHHQNQRLDNIQHLLTQLQRSRHSCSPPHRQHLAIRSAHRPTAQQAYQPILNALHHKKYNLAYKKLRYFLKAYPQDVHRPNALYWLGSIEVIKGQWHAGMQQFLYLVHHYPHHPQTPYAMLRIGLLYTNTGQKQQAHRWFKRLKKHYPHSPATRAIPKKHRHTR